MAVNPLVIEDAAVPGAANSYYSAQKSLSTPGTNAFTLVPEIGWIQALAVANIVWALRITTSPTYVTLIPANTPGMVWSDGTNIFVSKTTGGAGNALYYVLQHKP
jgi:hypothetical protein